MDDNLNSRNPEPGQPETKQSIRSRVWQDLFEKKQIRRRFGGIPNFEGTEEAAKRLLTLPDFQSSKSVEVNPDKTLEYCRILVLENDKLLYVPPPQLRGSLLKKLEKIENTSLQKIVSRWGINNLGKEIGLDDSIHIDLLVLSSVAVSRQGHRIGKGKGFADLEFALMKEMNAIDDSTVIVTVVHDLQVFDELPMDLFQVYDVPVDYIVTPTETIKCPSTLPKPKGIYWELLTEWRIKFIKILQELKEKHENEGKTVILKPSENPENQKRDRYQYRRNYRTSRRSLPPKEGNSEDNKSTAANNTNSTTENASLRVRKRKKSRKNFSGYSVHVSNIQRSVRVRDLKNALTEKGIRPSSITWKGFRGYCYLHYPKNRKKDEREDTPDPLAIDDIIQLIQEMNLNPDLEQSLAVKLIESIAKTEIGTSIETSSAER